MHLDTAPGARAAVLEDLVLPAPVPGLTDPSPEAPSAAPGASVPSPRASSRVTTT